jgi:hypothetical protein
MEVLMAVKLKIVEGWDVRVLADGRIRIETDKIGEVYHVDADKLQRKIDELLGGVETIKSKSKHTHTHVHVGEKLKQH